MLANEHLDRFKLRVGNFRSALSRLQEMLTQNEDEAVRDAIVLRYLLTFEAAWKAMYQYLIANGERVGDSAWVVLPEAFKVGLIADATAWDQARKYRNIIGHDYDKPKSIEIAAYVRKEGIAAFETLAVKLSEAMEKMHE